MEHWKGSIDRVECSEGWNIGRESVGGGALGVDHWEREHLMGRALLGGVEHWEEEHLLNSCHWEGKCWEGGALGR